jgi:CRISPR-associated endonuclease/helicase Cas3
MVEKGFFNDETGERQSRKRECLDSVLEAIERQILKSGPTLTFVQLPPGYGKTAIPYSLSLWAASLDELYLERSIHVLPLRSIVEDSWGRFKRGLRNLGLQDHEVEGVAGAQCMFIHGSPFLQKALAITTLDTFTLLAVKLPPTEIRKIAHKRSLGHYEVARGALFSSVVVFDEVHLFFEERSGKGYERPLTALLGLIRALLVWCVPVIIVTATLPQVWRQELKEFFEGYAPKPLAMELTYGVNGLTDKEFDSEVSSASMHTRTFNSDENYMKEIADAARSYERLLVVANTIERARALYEKLKDYGPILLHSKFTQGDREGRLERIRGKGGRWFCISTQVIEAGVDISAQALFTDIAPPCALIQRGGRCCRPPYEKGEEGEVGVCISEEAISHAHKIYDSNSLEKSRKVLGKITSNFNWHSYAEYMPLLESAYSERDRQGRRINHSQLTHMLKLLLDPRWESTDAFNLLLELGSLTRDEPLITGVVCEDQEVSDGMEALSKCRGRLIPLELKDLLNILRRCGIKLLTVDGKKGIELKSSSKEMLYKLYKEMLYGDVVAVQVPPELYDRERGLLI